MKTNNNLNQIPMGFKQTDIGLIPEDWELHELSSIAKITSGGTPSRKIPKYYSGNHLWVKSGELEDNYISDTEEKITQEAIENSSAKIFPVNSILIAMYGATVGKTAILLKEATTNQAVCAIMPNYKKFEPEFVRFYLITIKDKFLSQRYGGAQPNISQNIIKNTIIPLPPLSEQKKIAHVLSKIQQTIEIQEQIIKTTQELKKALMQKLFTEGLNGEPQKQTEIGPIPQSWEVVKIGDVIESIIYGLSLKGKTDGKYPALRMTNQKDGKTILKNLQYLDLDDKTYSKFNLEKGDLLFNRTNSIDLVGRTSIFEDTIDAVFFSYLIRIRLKKKIIMPDFMNYFFNKVETQKELKKIASRGVSQSNISAARLKTFLIPLPPIEEQKEIVKILSSLVSKIEIYNNYKSQLEDLFKTFLNQLMTGQIRVKDIEFKFEET